MVRCGLCGKEMEVVGWEHLARKHNKTNVAEYRAMGHKTGRERLCAFCGHEFVPAFRYDERFCDQCGINDPDLLRCWYWDEELNQREIAERLGVSGSLVGQRMQQFGINRRSQAMATHLASGNEMHLTHEGYELLAGCLLGDASITPNKSISAAYQQVCIHREYLVWLQDAFASEGMECLPDIATLDHKVGNTAYLLVSRSYPGLSTIRKEWYPDGKKSPPDNLVLTPTVVLHWYLGDGNYRERGRCSKEVRICNTAFPQTSRELLQRKLAKNGIETTLSWDTFRIRNRCIDRFFEFIGSCPVPDSFGYKWPSSYQYSLPTVEHGISLDQS